MNSIVSWPGFWLSADWLSCRNFKIFTFVLHFIFKTFRPTTFFPSLLPDDILVRIPASVRQHRYIAPRVLHLISRLPPGFTRPLGFTGHAYRITYRTAIELKRVFICVYICAHTSRPLLKFTANTIKTLVPYPLFFDGGGFVYIRLGLRRVCATLLRIRLTTMPGGHFPFGDRRTRIALSIADESSCLERRHAPAYTCDDQDENDFRR